MPFFASMPTTILPGRARAALYQLRVAQGNGAEDDAGNAGLQPGIDLRPRADAAAELHRRIGGFQDRLHRRAVHGLALEGAVQVHHVKMGEACVAEGFGLRRRAVGEDSRLVHLAPEEAHALAVFQVDGGVEGKGHFGVRAPIAGNWRGS
jgi:hypothetical protein